MSREAKRTITVKGRHGWTLARTCVDIAHHMKKTDLDAEIRAFKDGREFRIGPACKPSVLRLLTIHPEEGDQLEVYAVGPDAEEALGVFEATAHRCALDWAERLASQTDH